MNEIDEFPLFWSLVQKVGASKSNGQAEAEVVPSSSLVEVEVWLRLRLGLGLRLGVVKVSDQDLVQHIKS